MARCSEEDSPHGQHESPLATGAPAATTWSDAEGVHIDVRALPPPWPLVEVLRLLESDRHDGVIIAYLPRDPLHLYPELAERGWTATRLDSDPGEFRIRLHRT